MDIRTFFNKKRGVEEESDHEELGSSKQMEAQDTIATPSPMETGSVKHFGIISYGIPSDIAQIGEPIKQVILELYPKKITGPL